MAKTAAVSNAIQEEKARAMFIKYGFTLDPGDWTSPTSGDAERVEKVVRVRVRRTCHRCDIPFGADKTCISCKHTRCKKCPRYPAKRPPPEERGKGAALKRLTIAVDETYQGRPDPAEAPLTIRQRTAGKELAELEPAPSGDEGQTYPLARRQYKEILQRVRWRCHACHTIFKGPETECRACGQERGEESTREPPEEEEAPVDEAAVERIAARMKNVNISPQAPAA